MHTQALSSKITGVRTTPENQHRKGNFNKGFTLRTKILREAAGLSADTVAKSLGVKVDTYYRYESKVPMPAYLIPEFLELTGGDCRYLLGIRKPNLD